MIEERGGNGRSFLTRAECVDLLGNFHLIGPGGPLNFKKLSFDGSCLWGDKDILWVGLSQVAEIGGILTRRSGFYIYLGHDVEKMLELRRYVVVANFKKLWRIDRDTYRYHQQFITWLAAEDMEPTEFMLAYMEGLAMRALESEIELGECFSIFEQLMALSEFKIRQCEFGCDCGEDLNGSEFKREIVFAILRAVMLDFSRLNENVVRWLTSEAGGELLLLELMVRFSRSESDVSADDVISLLMVYSAHSRSQYESLNDDARDEFLRSLKLKSSLLRFRLKCDSVEVGCFDFGPNCARLGFRELVGDLLRQMEIAKALAERQSYYCSIGFDMTPVEERFLYFSPIEDIIVPLYKVLVQFIGDSTVDLDEREFARVRLTGSIAELSLSDATVRQLRSDGFETISDLIFEYSKGSLYRRYNRSRIKVGDALVHYVMLGEKWRKSGR